MMTNFNFKVGADPEFTCVRRGTVIRASDFVTSGDRFGADGGGTSFEVRPSPSENPLEVVNNIRSAFLEGVSRNVELIKAEWFAGSYYGGQPLGGHIHFGIKKNWRGQIDNYSPFLNILDHYLGLPLLLIEDRQQGLERRSGGSYGRLSDNRVQSHGVEYRAPSSWLTSPYIASAVLCLAKTVAWEFVNNSEFAVEPFLVQDHFRCMRTRLFYEKFPDIWAKIKKMHLYQIHKPYIDIIYFLISNKLTWFQKNRDMKETWAVFHSSQKPEIKVDLNILWAPFTQTL